MYMPNFRTTVRYLPYISRCIWLSAAILFGTVAAHAQTGPFGFDGSIVAPDPHFDYPPIQLRLLRDAFDGQTLAYAYTEGTGRFAFKGLAEGTYYLVAHVDGYQDIVERVDLTSRVRAMLHGVNIILKPRVSDAD